MLGEQRVACGASHRRLHEVEVGVLAEQVRDQASGVVRSESFERYPLGDIEPGELGEPGGERGPGDDGVVAVGDDDEDTFVGQVGGEEPDEVEGRAVRPLDVLDHECRRRGGSEAFQQGEHRLEETERRRHPELGAAGRPGGLGPRNQTGEVGGPLELQVPGPRPAQSMQRLGEWREGQRVACHRDAGAVEQRHRLGGDELLDEPGLPDPGLSGHQKETRTAVRGTPHRRLEDSETQLPTHQGSRRTLHH